MKSLLTSQRNTSKKQQSCCEERTSSAGIIPPAFLHAKCSQPALESRAVEDVIPTPGHWSRLARRSAPRIHHHIAGSVSTLSIRAGQHSISLGLYHHNNQQHP